MNELQQSYYKKMRLQISKWLQKSLGKDSPWTDVILMAPDLFHLICKLAVDEEVPSAKKVKLIAAIAYFISPIDFIPEIVFGPIGYLDDIAVTVYVLNDLINDIDPQIVVRNWAGERDILNLVKTIFLNSDRMVGSGMWRKIKKNF